HRLGDRRGAQADARVVPARGHDLRRPALLVDGTPGHLNARRRFQGNTHENVLSARAAAERAAGRVLLEALGRELVAMLAAALPHAREAVAELHAFDGIDAHQAFRDLGFELVEHGLAETHRHAARDEIDARADRIAHRAQL